MRIVPSKSASGSRRSRRKPRPTRSESKGTGMAKKTTKKARKTAPRKATRAGAKMGPPPPQAQKQSGKEYQMTPRPESQAREYLAAGKLRD
jgi:hypothetical protein